MSHSPYTNKKVMEDWLEDLGVLDTLATAAKIIQLAANNPDYPEHARNASKGMNHYELVAENLNRVTLTGDKFATFQKEPIAENLEALATDLPQEAYPLLRDLSLPRGLYRSDSYKNMPFWEVSTCCSLVMQSANRFGGIDKIRWESSTKKRIISATNHYVQDTLDIPGLDDLVEDLPLRLPILVVAYNISPEGELKEFVLGLPAPVERRSQSLWVWNIDVLARAASSGSPSVAASSAQEVQPTNRSEAPAVPDAHVKLKKAAE